MGPLPVRAAALSVTGRGVDDTITAVQASGSTWGGSVTLRITVADPSGAFGSDEHSTACFRYRFTYPRNPDWGTPHQVQCSSNRPLDLNHPRLPAGISDATHKTVVAAVARLTEVQRRSPVDLTQAIQTAIGRYYTIRASRHGRGAFAWIRYGDECMSVRTSGAGPRVSNPLQGLDCSGG